MHLYMMQKSEILLTIVTFVSLFVLCLFIGLAGPNSVRMDSVKASKMLRQQQNQQQRQYKQSVVDTRLLISEKYYIMTPLVSSYCQQLNLWIKFDLANITATTNKWPPITTTNENNNYPVDNQFKEDLYMSQRTIVQSDYDQLDDDKRNTKLSDNHTRENAPANLHNLPVGLYLSVEVFQETPALNANNRQQSQQHTHSVHPKALMYAGMYQAARRRRKKRQPLYDRIGEMNKRQKMLDIQNKHLRRNLTCSSTSSGSIAIRDANNNSVMECKPVEIVHLTRLDYASYKFGVHFTNETIDKILNLATQDSIQLKEITFTLQSINTSFTILIIWFRLVLLLISIAATCLFITCLYKYPFRDWSLEQRWTTILLVLLIASDNPLFPMRLIFDSVLPRLLDNMFDTIFIATLSLYWLCFSHGIRQTNRDIITFYLPKLLLVCSLWSITLYGSIWSIYKQSFEPSSDEAQLYEGSALFQLMNVIFYLLLALYLGYLVYLFTIAMAELRFMSFLDIRLKIQMFFCLFILFVYASIIWLNQSDGTSDEEMITSGAWSQYPPLLRLVPINYKISSAGACLSYHALNNLYLITCVYLYYPHMRSLPQSLLAQESSSLSIFKEDFCNEELEEEDQADNQEGNQDEEEVVYALDNDIGIAKQDNNVAVTSSKLD